MIVSELDDHVVVRFQKTTQLRQTIVESNLNEERENEHAAAEVRKVYRDELIGHRFRCRILGSDDTA